MTFICTFFTIAAILAFTYFRAPLYLWTAAAVLGLLGLGYFDHLSMFTTIIAWTILAIVAIPLNVGFIRRRFLINPLFNFYGKIQPSMSSTEREALEAGTVSWEGELFAGRPHWQNLLALPKPTLSAEEQAFMDGPVETLCGMLNDWQITHEYADLPPQVWDYLKQQGFFALIIPKEYGGLDFSAYAHAQILIKVYGVSVTAGSTIAVPNSLGPAELILKYGTQAQKDYYLPRLAKGEEIPCFALTGPDAGSDASAMTDTGVVCHGEYEGERILGIKLNWNKRYITLAPVATVIGLAFKLYDPEHLLGDIEELGITCALIPAGTSGVSVGRRHFPLNAVFQNGPTQGKDVFIPMDWLIGGQEMIGTGWRMLVECLSVGRAISLPSGGIGGAKVAAASAGAYARIRKQFNVPIGRFEGVEEALTRIAGFTYIVDAVGRMTTGLIDQGEKPSVPSAIVKYHVTELGRKVGNDAMDVHGGKGICMGPKNYLARGYQSIPIGITVEGANILTRSLIIFGQGAVRCHPYVLAEMHAAQEQDKVIGLKTFDKAIRGHIAHIASNLVKSFCLGITCGWLSKVPFAAKPKCYYRDFNRLSANFALLADISMAVMGASLKRKEKMSARLGDILSMLYLGSAVLKRYADDGYPKEDLALIHWSCQHLLQQAQTQNIRCFEQLP